jgi:hypothetical protein
MDDRNQDRDRDEAEASRGLVSRRKLVYAAPLLMSRRLFYRASGCGKVNQSQIPCRGIKAQGS